MTDLSTSTPVDNTTLPDTELPAAIEVARRMLTAYGTVDFGDLAALGQAHGALAESLRILLRAVDQTVEQHHYATAAADEANEHPPVGPGCGASATKLIEGYRPRNGLAHGSLDATVYACDEHAGAARAEWLAGMTPFSMASPSGRRCGDRFDYTSLGGGR